jgi:oxygen-dependent protoporphyrinogen oxidase
VIGTLDPRKKEILIIGGGFSGLIAAERLDRAGWEVTLMEAGRAGGLIKTTHTEFGIVEAAAHSFLATPTIRELCEDLGVELQSVKPDSKARYIYRDGQLRRFPLTIWEAFKTFLRAYFMLAAKPGTPAATDLESWGRRHVGRAAVDYLLTPFVRGIYGARPRELSVPAAFPRLSVPRGHSLLSFMLFKMLRGRKDARSGAQAARPKMMAPTKGVGDLVERLRDRVAGRLGSRFHENRRLEELPPYIDNLMLCVPAPEAARLLDAHDAKLASALREVPYAPLISATVFFARSAVPKHVRGVGVLVPERETDRACLGILFNSSSFQGRVTDTERFVSFTVMLGGTSGASLVGHSDHDLRELAATEAQALLGIRAKPLGVFLNRWQRAVPIYGPEVQRAWDAARVGWCSKPGRLLFGNYAGQVSLRGMVDSASHLAAGLHSR